MRVVREVRSAVAAVALRRESAVKERWLVAVVVVVAAGVADWQRYAQTVAAANGCCY